MNPIRTAPQASERALNERSFSPSSRLASRGPGGHHGAMSVPLHARPALELARLVARGEVGIVELTRLHLDRVAARNPGLGAFVEVRPEAALREARRLEAALRRAPGAPRSPLFGLPTGIKDLHFTRGFRTRLGTRTLPPILSPFDDVTSAAVRRGGLVILGKLATSELGILPVVETDIHPPARNPWDPRHTSGGSSGGSSAAIAAGLLPLAPASDGAGSVRIPAAFCGLVGHKPSRGLVPNPFAAVDPVGITVVGPHARTVPDAAALLDLLTGRAGSPQSFLSACETPPRPLRIGFTTTSPVGPVDPRVAEAVRSVLATLGALGHHVRESAPIHGDIDEFLPIYKFSVRNTFVPFASCLQPVGRWLRSEGRHVDLRAARAHAELLTRRLAGWFDGVDVLVTPTTPVLPPEVGAWRDLDGRETMYAAAQLGAFTAAFNATGQPATSIPVWLDGHSLPLGVQLVGHRGEDGLLLALSRALLEARGDATGRVAA
jgi:amidase